MNILNEKIKSLDGKPISKYSILYGRYSKSDVVYSVSSITGGQVKYCHVSIEIPCEKLFADYTVNSYDTVPVCSHILREFSVNVRIANDIMQQNEANVQKGCFMIYKFGQKILPNSIVTISEEKIIIALEVKLPYNTSAFTESTKKSGIISSHALRILLYKNMPQMIEDFIGQFDISGLISAVGLYANQRFIRYYLRQNGYVSFVANESVLPRKGKTDYKDAKNAVPFKSPPSMEIAIDLPSGEKISGMGIRKGVTVITGDAYHGKSTLINAVQNGVFNHCTGDGREYVITDESALSIKAEDGRSIKNTDISFFLKNPPLKDINAHAFTTDSASGSTSQAAAVYEAVESGCTLMLFDEDRSANNFMYKDEKMKNVIRNASTCPYIDNVRMFFRDYGVSSILVVGASAEYFKIADNVILVDRFAASEFTDYEKAADAGDCGKLYKIPRTRKADLRKLRADCLRRELSIPDNDTVKIGSEKITVTDFIPNATRGQLVFTGLFLYYLAAIESCASQPLSQAVNALYRKIDTDINVIRQDTLSGFSQIEYVRKYDMMSMICRLKGVMFNSR